MDEIAHMSMYSHLYLTVSSQALAQCSQTITASGSVRFKYMNGPVTSMFYTDSPCSL